MSIHFESQRIILRSFTQADAPVFAAYRSDPDIARYQSWDAPYSLERARQFVAKMQSIEPGIPGEWYQVAIVLKEGGQMIGDCAFCLLREDSRQAEIGFSLIQSYQGQGYATEAVESLLDYLFKDLWVHRVRAFCLIENRASAHLLERVGMRREGHFRQSFWHHEHWVDEYAYAILRDEWQERHANLPSAN